MPRSLPAVLALLLIAGCSAAGERPVRPIEFVLIDADAHGAIIGDMRRAEFLGVARDGRVVWRAPQSGAAPDAAECATRCPDALLSGNAAAWNTDDVPDPPAELIRDGRREMVGGTALTGRVKRTVLTASSPRDYVVTAGGPGRWTLDVVRPGAAPVRVPVPGPRLSWAATADGRHGIAVATGADPARAAAVWFTRTTAGWQPDPRPTLVAGSAACLAPDGASAMLLGTRPALRSRDGARRLVTDLDYASDCGLAASGGIVGTYRQDSGGPAFRIRVFDADGTVVWRADSRGTARVTADPAGARVAVAVAGTTTEVDTTTGAVLRTVGHAFAARYDGAGDLVVVDGNGVPRWWRSAVIPAARPG
ncbi:hypothetical protein [Paractinoplanes brasiliensis]|uniref:YD repeat-containing protein n=1 Tax=Paractinoplanes brasiliensis TaxID=52695 RepID=A0A4R6JX75_9ACTN|nr:hypothetical protein [Actinoplanes brasiliensis]TDO39295.1 hypothetical protein C8E87_2972 [Actinoplanes brasiliensis]GID30002.1 hypothetical protein Abr02nite_49850 [Actinoplanes brasiliensis]